MKKAKNEISISTKTMVNFWLIILAIAGVVGAIYLARWSIILILVSIFFALVLNRPTDFFARKLPGNRRWLGAIITFLIALIVLVGTVVLVVPIFLQQSETFLKSLPDTISSLQSQAAWVGEFAAEHQLEEIIESVGNSLLDQVKNLAASFASLSFGFINGAASALGAVCLVAVLTIFMLIEGPGWVDKLWVIFPSKKRKHYKEVANEMYHVVSGYVTGQIIVASINAVLAGVGVFILSLFFGTPTSLILPIAVLTFITTFIPIVGPVIGTAIAAILTLLYSPLAAIILAVYLTVYQQILWNIVSPKVQSKQIQISALIVMIAITIGIDVGGMFGAIVAVPVAGCLMILVRHIIDHGKNDKTKLEKIKDNTKKLKDKATKSATK